VSVSTSFTLRRAGGGFSAAVRYAPWWAIAVAVLLGWLAFRLPLAQAAALLLGGGLLLAIALRPLIGLGLLLLAAPWGAWEAHIINLGGFDSGQLLFFLTVAAWLGQGVLRRRIVIPRTPVTLPLALFGFVAALSLLNAPSTTLGLKELVKWVEVVVMMWLVADLVNDHGLRPVLALFLVAGTSQALLGLYQFGLQPEGPDHFAILDGRFYRAYGTFMQPNPFGAFVSWTALLGGGALAGVLLAWWQARRPRPALPELLWWVFLTACTALALGGLLASWSRGAWLAFAAAGAAFVVFLPRRRKAGVLLLGSALLAFVALWQLGLLPPSITLRLTSFSLDVPASQASIVDVRGVEFTDANYAVIERLAHWQAALAMARQQPWLGVGFGNYEAAYPEVALVNWPHPLGHAHNYYLNLLAEVGFFGLGAYLLLWAGIFGWTLRALRRDWPGRGVALGLLAVWVALTVHHSLDKLYVNNLYLHLGAMLGILHGLSPSRRHPVKWTGDEDAG
jgi:putative inorganic carbon (hco3(-)) transporter